ncbi:amidase family protein [Streptomyces sp. NBC_01022]|uniref:amidase family protein n=1 Tax=Streptomyces sp. NBC_01022 TaxID=2903723 RepID=UPI002DDBAAC7|nr:amidase family protein [Streptomyces sp. NBC_01022]WRZ84430.1 amidase family protein [Streptomyces sp. NBC_01022]
MTDFRDAAASDALAAIAREDPRLCAFTDVWREEALARLPAAARLPLAGLPFAVKGPAGIRSYAARRIVAAGGVPVGSTSVPGPGTHWKTWGLGAHGRTVNPWRPDRTPGGSSAGSAVAVAADLVELATGSDGAGSVRIPAAWCGVFGLKTTNGLLPSPDRSGLASAGVLTRTAAQARAYLRCVLDDDAYRDSYGDGPETAALPLRAVYSPDLGFADVDPEVAAVVRGAVRKLAAAGVVRLADGGCELLDPGAAWQAVRVGEVPPHLGEVRRENDRRLDAFFAGTPLLLTPVTPNRPHGHDGPGELFSTALTWAFNLSGHPAASVPAGFTPDGCPVGLQLVALRGADASLLAMACAVEDALGPVRP